MTEKLAQFRALVLVVDSSKEFCAEAVNSFRLVEGHFRVHFATLKMTGLAARLKDWLYLRTEIRLVRG